MHSSHISNIQVFASAAIVPKCWEVQALPRSFLQQGSVTNLFGGRDKAMFFVPVPEVWKPIRKSRELTDYYNNENGERQMETFHIVLSRFVCVLSASSAFWKGLTDKRVDMNTWLKSKENIFHIKQIMYQLQCAYSIPKHRKELLWHPDTVWTPLPYKGGSRLLIRLVRGRRSIVQYCRHTDSPNDKGALRWVPLDGEETPSSFFPRKRTCETPTQCTA